jgi:DNA-binding response OmpR family regulator
LIEVSKIRSARRRVHRTGNLEIRPAELQILIEGRRIGLTVREFELLLRLSEHQDRVVRRTEIYRLVWGDEMRRRDRSVDVVIHRVRAKLGRIAPDWRYIHTHFGIGYRFAPERLERPSALPARSAAGD